MPDFLTDSFTLRMGWTLMHFVWQGALVALLLAGALRLLHGRSPQARYAAALTALALMAVLPVLTWHALPEASAVPPTAVRDISPARVETLHATPLQVKRQIALNQTAAPTTYWTALQKVEARLAVLLPYLVLGWLGGVLVLGARLTGGWVQVQRLRGRDAHPVEGRWRRRFEALARQMGLSGRVRLLQSARADGPLALGWWRPAVLVPGSLLTGLPPEQVEAILAHELAHIRRYDYAVNLAQSALEVLLFYHPAVWWVSAQVRREREYCCDDLAAAACRSRLTYARALTGLEALRSPRLAPGAADGSLLHRIRRIVHPAPPGPSASRTTAALAAVGIAVVLVLAGSYFPHRADAETAPSPAPVEPPTEGAAPFDTSLTDGGPVRIALPGDTLFLGLPPIDTLRERIRIVDVHRLDSLRRPLLIWADSISDVAALVHFREQVSPFMFELDSLKGIFSELEDFSDFSVDSLTSSLLQLEMDSLEMLFPQNSLWRQKGEPHVFSYNDADTLEHPPEIIFRMEPPRPGGPPLPPDGFGYLQDWDIPDVRELMAPYRAFVDTTDWQALRRQIQESMEEARRAREEALRAWRAHRQEWEQEYQREWQEEMEERRRELAELRRERQEEVEQRLRELREQREEAHGERQEALRELREELRQERDGLREEQAEALQEAAEALDEQAEQLREQLSAVDDDSDFALEKRRLLREQIRTFEQQARRLRERARELERN